jgi:hypothetical protein
MNRPLIAALLTLNACASSLDFDRALDDRFLADTPVQAGQAVQGIEDAKKAIEEHGYCLRQKRVGKMSTTTRRCVWLSKGFEDQTLNAQLQTLRHELVHIRQWEHYGRGFLTRYADEETRWVLEMHGFRQEVRDLCDMGYSVERVEKHVEHVASRVGKAYKFVVLDREDVRLATRYLLKEEMLNYSGCEDSWHESFPEEFVASALHSDEEAL